jgi:hypothetical protein
MVRFERGRQWIAGVFDSRHVVSYQELLIAIAWPVSLQQRTNVSLCRDIDIGSGNSRCTNSVTLIVIQHLIQQLQN